MQYTTKPTAIGVTVESICESMTADSPAPAAVDIIPTTADAVPAMWPIGSIANDVSVGPTSDVLQIIATMNTNHTQTLGRPSVARQTTSCPSDRITVATSEPTPSRVAPVAVHHPRAREQHEPHRRGGDGEEGGELVAASVDLVEDRLRATEEAVERAEREAQGERVAERHRRAAHGTERGERRSEREWPPAVDRQRLAEPVRPDDRADGHQARGRPS